MQSAARRNSLPIKSYQDKSCGLASVAPLVCAAARASKSDGLKLFPHRCHADRLGGGSKGRARHADQSSARWIEGEAEDLGCIFVLHVDKLIAGRDRHIPDARSGFGSARDGERAIRMDAVRGYAPSVIRHDGEVTCPVHSHALEVAQKF